MCLHFLLFHANNTLNTSCTYKITAPRILWRFSFFLKNKDFCEIKVLIQKKFGVYSNKQVLEIQEISQHLKNLKNNPNAIR